MSHQVRWKITQGADFEKIITLKYQGNLVDLTTYDLSIRVTPQGKTPILYTSQSGHISYYDDNPLSGKFVFFIGYAETTLFSTWTSAKFDVNLLYPVDRNRRIITGTITLSRRA